MAEHHMHSKFESDLEDDKSGWKTVYYSKEMEESRQTITKSYTPETDKIYIKNCPTFTSENRKTSGSKDINVKTTDTRTSTSFEGEQSWKGSSLNEESEEVTGLNTKKFRRTDPNTNEVTYITEVSFPVETPLKEVEIALDQP